MMKGKKRLLGLFLGLCILFTGCQSPSGTVFPKPEADKFTAEVGQYYTLPYADDAVIKNSTSAEMTIENGKVFFDTMGEYSYSFKSDGKSHQKTLLVRDTTAPKFLELPAEHLRTVRGSKKELTVKCEDDFDLTIIQAADNSGEDISVKYEVFHNGTEKIALAENATTFEAEFGYYIINAIAGDSSGNVYSKRFRLNVEGIGTVERELNEIESFNNPLVVPYCVTSGKDTMKTSRNDNSDFAVTGSSLKVEVSGSHVVGDITIGSLNKDVTEGQYIAYWQYIDAPSHEGVFSAFSAGYLGDYLPNGSALRTNANTTMRVPNVWTRHYIPITADATIESLKFSFDNSDRGFAGGKPVTNGGTWSTASKNAYNVYIDDIEVVDSISESADVLNSFDYAVYDFTANWRFIDGSRQADVSFNTDTDYVKTGTGSVRLDISGDFTGGDITFAPTGSTAFTEGDYVSFWTYSTVELSGFAAGFVRSITPSNQTTAKYAANTWHRRVARIPAGFGGSALKLEFDNTQRGWSGNTDGDWATASGNAYTVYIDDIQVIECDADVIEDFEFGVSAITKGGSLSSKVEVSINTNLAYTHGESSKGSLKLEFNSENPAGAIGITELGARNYKKGDIISYWVYVDTNVSPVKGWAAGRINHEGGGSSGLVNNQATFVTSNIETKTWVNAQVRIIADKTNVSDIQLYFDAATAGINSTAYTVYIDDITYIEDSLDAATGIEDFEFATGDYAKTGNVTLSYNTNMSYVKSGTQSLKAEIPNTVDHSITLNNINIPAGAKENGGYISYWVYVAIDSSVTEITGFAAGKNLGIAGQSTPMVQEKIDTNNWHNYIIKVPAGNTMELKISISNSDVGFGTGGTWGASGKAYTLYLDKFEYIPATVDNMIDDFEYDQKNYAANNAAKTSVVINEDLSFVKSGSSSLKVTAIAGSDYPGFTLSSTGAISVGDKVSFWVYVDTSATDGTPQKVGGFLIGSLDIADVYEIEDAAGNAVTTTHSAYEPPTKNWYNYASLNAGQWYKVTATIKTASTNLELKMGNHQIAWDVPINGSTSGGWAASGKGYVVYYDDFTVIRAAA